MLIFTLMQRHTPISTLYSLSLSPTLPHSHSTWLLLLVHKPHDVLHEVPALLCVLWSLGLLHQVRDLYLSPGEGGEEDPHLLQDGHVLSVAEVQRVDVQPGRSMRFSSRRTGKIKNLFNTRLVFLAKIVTKLINRFLYGQCGY